MNTGIENKDITFHNKGAPSEIKPGNFLKMQNTLSHNYCLDHIEKRDYMYYLNVLFSKK